ncbi:hypothetical protein D3C83_111400 [compost metagenome]
MKRAVRYTWNTMVIRLTKRSMRAKNAVRSPRSLNASATSSACWKYKTVEQKVINRMNSAMPVR